ncbi:MAG: hypothetical protein QME41_05415 [Actinomycetota bacterium]|nr:hypothetical protein [Actinomycetota bacterium]
MVDDTSANAESLRSWLLATYRPVSLFSLRTTYATNKGGKTLLVPTPYAVKLALVDACFRAFEAGDAETIAREVFDLVRGRQIRFSPPERCIVQNTFVKVKQEEREAPKGIYCSTVSYREFCFFSGDMTIALDTSGMSKEESDRLINIMRHINYLGKRGGFFQHIGSKVVVDLPSGFSLFEDDTSFEMDTYGVMQALDDIGEPNTPDLFDRVNSYSQGKGVTLGKHRVLKNTFLPYRMVQSSRSYTYYERG